jgi:thymidylate synthase (FAD)
MDSRLKVAAIAQTQNPQQVMYQAMHQDYCDRWICDEKIPSEEECGDILVKRLLAGNRGHFGVLENTHIALACGYFPHSVMQQARTHRIGISFDVQSYRYTSKSVIAVAEDTKDIEDVFYLRPVGEYCDRSGKRYHYSEERRLRDVTWCIEAARRYKQDIESGMSEEHARGKLPFDYRQHFVVSFNLRSLLHFLDLRAKKDAQLEIQWLCELMLPHLDAWSPAIALWYRENRLGKARLSP